MLFVSRTAFVVLSIPNRRLRHMGSPMPVPSVGDKFEDRRSRSQPCFATHHLHIAVLLGINFGKIIHALKSMDFQSSCGDCLAGCSYRKLPLPCYFTGCFKTISTVLNVISISHPSRDWVQSGLGRHWPLKAVLHCIEPTHLFIRPFLVFVLGLFPTLGLGP